MFLKQSACKSTAKIGAFVPEEDGGGWRRVLVLGLTEPSLPRALLKRPGVGRLLLPGLPAPCHPAPGPRARTGLPCDRHSCANKRKGGEDRLKP